MNAGHIRALINLVLVVWIMALCPQLYWLSWRLWWTRNITLQLRRVVFSWQIIFLANQCVPECVHMCDPDLKLLFRYDQKVVWAVHVRWASQVVSNLQGLRERSPMTVQHCYPNNRSSVHQLDLLSWKKGRKTECYNKKTEMVDTVYPKHQRPFLTLLCCDWFVCSVLYRRKAEHVCKHTAPIRPCPQGGWVMWTYKKMRRPVKTLE